MTPYNSHTTQPAIHSADHGADVIKVESPGGGDSTRQIGPARHRGMGRLSLNLNRSKRSVVLDLKPSGGLEAMRRLLAGADVFMHNLRPASHHIDHVYAFLGDTLAGRGSAEWRSPFDAIDVPAAPLNSVDSLLDDPHIRAVSLVPGVEHQSEGTLRMPRVPVDWSDHRPGAIEPAPRLGEHSESVLQECGYGEQGIAALLNRGAASTSAPQAMP